MIPVYQDTFNGPGTSGNCAQAAIASILELPLEAVPDFHSDAHTKQADKIAAFVQRYGYDYVLVSSKDVRRLPAAYHLISGRSPRDSRHLVVGYQGKIVHDPHPKGGGVIIDRYGFLVPLELVRNSDKIRGTGFYDTTPPETSPMAFDTRTVVGGLLGALVVGGAAHYFTMSKSARKHTAIPWAGLAAGAAAGGLVAYATSSATEGVNGVGTVSLTDVRDAKRSAKIASAEARTAREQTEIARGQRRQERERKKKGISSIDVAQAEATATEEGYDAELLARRADQFDEEDDDDGIETAGVGRISFGRIKNFAGFKAGGGFLSGGDDDADEEDDMDEDDEDDDDDEGDEPAPRQQARRAAPARGGPPPQEQALPSMLAGAATSTTQRAHQVRPGQQRPQQKRPGPQRPQGRPQQRPAPKPAAEAAPKEDEFPVLGFAAGPGAGGMGGGAMMGMGMGMFGGK